MTKLNALSQSLFKLVLLIVFICAASLSRASDIRPTFIPIGVGDITTFIPLLSAPSVVVNSGGNNTYDLSWNAVSNASYYQLLVVDENGKQTARKVSGTAYSLADLPLGQSSVSLLACNAQDQCGAEEAIGTYTISERVTYVHSDFLGSPILKTDAAGNKVAEFHYKPFGETKEEKKEEVGYTGHLEDTDLDLTYMQARYYDAHIGRFYGNDPVDAFGHVERGNAVHGFNRYTYGNNNPYKYVDPDGEFGVLGAAIGAAVGFVTSLDAGMKSDLSGSALFAKVAVGTLVGAATGVAGGALGSSVVKAITASAGKAAAFTLGHTALGAASGVSSSAVGDLAAGQAPSLGKMGEAAGKGAVIGLSALAPAAMGEVVGAAAFGSVAAGEIVGSVTAAAVTITTELVLNEDETSSN